MAGIEGVGVGVEFWAVIRRTDVTGTECGLEIKEVKAE